MYMGKYLESKNDDVVIATADYYCSIVSVERFQRLPDKLIKGMKILMKTTHLRIIRENILMVISLSLIYSS